jgi:tetratricopeptide (TPR) repeat protein
MSYIDLIIKYLSGDLSREESASFEKELKSNSELRGAFDDYSAAYRLIRDQLQKKDGAEFRRKLQEAMSPEVQVPGTRRKPLWHWWYLPFAAASLFAAIILFSHRGHSGNEKILSRYYAPDRDRVVLALDQNIRGGTEPGIIQYRSGNYQSAMEMLSQSFSEESENRLLRLFYLLSAIELDRQDEVMELVMTEPSEKMDLTDQALTWYTTMALLKSGRREEALKEIRPLTLQQGPYRSDATRLEKELLK